MKILQVNNVYGRGSTGKIVSDLHRALKRNGIESVVCYGRGPVVNEEDVHKLSSELVAKFNILRARFTGLPYGGASAATNRLFQIIRIEQPDIVHLHCINEQTVDIYRLLNYLKKNRVKTVLTLHAEFLHTGSCGHAYECEKWKSGCGGCPQLWAATKSYYFDRTHTAWKRMKDAFCGFDNLEIIAVSKWLEDRAKQSPIMSQYPFATILNGLDTDDVFRIAASLAHDRLRKKHNLKKEEKVVLHVTANFSLREDD